MDSIELITQAIGGEVSITDPIHVLETIEEGEEIPAKIISGKLGVASFVLKKERKDVLFTLTDKLEFSTELDESTIHKVPHNIIFEEPHTGFEYFTTIPDLERALRSKKIEFTENLFRHLKSFERLPADLFMKPGEIFNKVSNEELKIGDQVFELSYKEGSIEIISGNIYQNPTKDDKAMKLSNKMLFTVDADKVIDYEEQRMLHVMWPTGNDAYFTDVNKLKEALNIYGVNMTDNLSNYLDTLSQNQEIKD